MEQQKIIEKMIDLHKTFFESYFSMMVLLQDQTENLLKPYINGFPGMNNENKKVLDQCINEYKRSRDEFKKAIDKGYAKAETFFDYNAMLRFQEQNEKIFSDFLKQASWMPGDFKKATEELAATYKNSLGNFKKYVEEKVNHVEDFSSSAKRSARRPNSKNKFSDLR
ncbi:MAG: hypothetical protein JW925_03865 [Syntrophaceae bacterium]|nr:hypothetical protein [Syntrophaceae bacterium]